MPVEPSAATAIDADEPVAPTEADEPAPDSAPTVKPLDVLATAPVFEMVCPTVPAVVPAISPGAAPTPPIVATDTEPDAPVEPTEADEPMPDTAPTVRPVEVLPTVPLLVTV